MEHVYHHEVKCLKDGKTGKCFEIVDEKARQTLSSLKEIVDTLAGSEGGHLATDEDLANLTNEINNALETLSNNFNTALANAPKIHFFHNDYDHTYVDLKRSTWTAPLSNYNVTINVGDFLVKTGYLREEATCYISIAKVNKIYFDSETLNRDVLEAHTITYITGGGNGATGDFATSEDLDTLQNNITQYIQYLAEDIGTALEGMETNIGALDSTTQELTGRVETLENAGGSGVIYTEKSGYTNTLDNVTNITSFTTDTSDFPLIKVGDFVLRWGKIQSTERTYLQLCKVSAVSDNQDGTKHISFIINFKHIEPEVDTTEIEQDIDALESTTQELTTRVETLENAGGSGGSGGGMALKSQTFTSFSEIARFIGGIGLEKVQCVKISDGNVNLNKDFIYYDNTTNSYTTIANQQVILHPVIRPVNIASNGFVSFMAQTSCGSITLGMSTTSSAIKYTGTVISSVSVNNITIPAFHKFSVSSAETWTPTVYYFE